MNRKKFLNRLRRRLSLHFSGREVCEIVEEYRMFFESGFHEGKTEEEMVEMLGDPREIVSTLICRPYSIFSAKLLRHLIFSSVALLSSWYLLYPGGVGLFLSGLLWPVFWFILGGRLSELPSYSAPSFAISPFGRRGLVILQIFTVCLMFSAWVFHTMVIAGVLYGTTITAGMWIFMSIALLLLFIAAVGFVAGCPAYYSLLCHAGGALMSLYSLFHFYQNVDGFADLGAIGEIRLAVPYLIGALFAVLFGVFIKHLERKTLMLTGGLSANLSSGGNEKSSTGKESLR